MASFRRMRTYRNRPVWHAGRSGTPHRRDQGKPGNRVSRHHLKGTSFSPFLKRGASGGGRMRSLGGHLIEECYLQAHLTARSLASVHLLSPRRSFCFFRIPVFFRQIQMYERDSGGSGVLVHLLGLFTGLVRLQELHSPGPRGLPGGFT